MKNLLHWLKKTTTKAGDVVGECCERYECDYYVKEFGPVTKTKALQMFRLYKAREREQAAMAEW